MMWRVFLALLLPCVSYAQIEITEIMYDPEGSDSGREWVEIHNGTNGDVDLTDWRFNDGSNHLLNEPPKNGGQGSLVLPMGAYVVFADKADIFLSEHPGFSGTVIDTAMSMGQQSDRTYILQLIDSEGVVINSASYTILLGANGDGSSLQKINGSFVASLPTPGEANRYVPLTNPDSQSGGDTQSGQEEGITGSNSSFPVESKIKTSISGPTNGLSGVEVYFKAETTGLTGAFLPGARHLWTFGDGSFAEGNSVVHTYSFPGSYTVALEASSEEYAASSRHRIVISEPKISLKNVMSGKEGFVEIENGATFEVDLSYWQIRSGGFYFIFPKNTFISPMTSAKFPNSVTNLELIPSDTHLLYPSGFIAIKYEANPPISYSSVTEVSQDKPVIIPESKKVTETVVKPPPASSELSREEELSFFPATSSLALAEMSFEKGQSGNKLIWFGMMFAVIVISSIGFLSLVKKNNNQELSEKSEVYVEGQKYTIFEDKSS